MGMEGDVTGRFARRMLVAAAVLAGIGVLAFKLFEPVFHYAAGWEPLPDGPWPSTSVRALGWEETAAEADAWLVETRAAIGAPALSAAVSVDGERVWAGVAGYADLAARKAATLETAFRIGSSSKALTSIAIGVVLDEGALDLDAPVSRYVPDLAAPLASITTRQAMSHTAGVREYGLCACFPIWEYYSTKHYASQRDALRPFERSELLFSPGEEFSYSSYGYNLAGAVIEGVTGSSFGDHLRVRVAEPLGLSGTRAEDGARHPDDATLYELRDGRYLEVFRIDNTNRLAAGGIVSTPSDMVRLGHQMIAPTLFGAATRDALLRRQPLADGRPNPQGYALGWRVHELDILDGAEKTLVLHHHGVAYGAVSNFSVYPEHGVVVSVMISRNQGAYDGAPNRLASLFIAAVKASAAAAGVEGLSADGAASPGGEAASVDGAAR